SEAPGSKLSLMMIPGGPYRWLIGPRSDDLRYSTRSDLQLWVNGAPWGPAHSEHSLIRQGNTHAFSHWRDTLYFSIPVELNNDQSKLTISYKVKLIPNLLFGLLGATIACIFFSSRRNPQYAYSISLFIAFVLRTIPLILVYFAIFYFLTIIYG